MDKFGLVGLSLRRPVLIIVINVLIIVAGIAAYFGINVRELPNVDRPQVSVRAAYPGASPETMDSEVTRILEGAVARVSGVRRIESSSEEFSTRMNIEFRVGVNLDVAANDVREAVSRVERDLPEDVEQIVVIKADDEADGILQLSALSDILDQQALTERLEKDIVPALLSVDGVADVRLDGLQPRVMRVEFDPLKLARYNIAIDEVVAALADTRFDVPAGSYESTDQELLIRADASLLDPAAVESLLIRKNIRLKQFANVFFAPEDPDSYSLLNGRMVVGLAVLRQAGSNTIQISNDIRQQIDIINAASDDLRIEVTSDQANYIRGALFEVILSLCIAVAVVLLIVGLFLGTIKATLIPAVTMPISLIGTLAVVWLLGFSINLLTLLAFVLATGLIVDDAIVVLENIQRRQKEGDKSRAAAVLGTREVFFAVIATTLTLIAVFVPIALLAGQTGRLFREFAVVLAVSVSISSFVALTICPLMASRLLKNAPIDTDGLTTNALENFGGQVKQYYLRSLSWFVARPALGLIAALVLSIGGVIGFNSLNQELLPQEDRGELQMELTGPDGASLAYIDRQALKVNQLLAQYQQAGLITDIFTIVGRRDKNKAFIQVQLKPWSERSITQMALASQLSDELKGFAGANLRISQPSSLSVRGGGQGLALALTGNDYDVILPAAEKFAKAIEDKVPQITNTDVEFDVSQPELRFQIDRQAAIDLQVPLSRISQSLQIMVDRFELLDLSIDDSAVPLVLAPAGGTFKNADDLLNIFISNQVGDLIPLSSMVIVKEQGIAAELDRQAQRRAIEISVSTAPAAPLGDLVSAIRELAAQTLPPDVNIIFLGEAADLEAANYDLAITFAMALVIVFLVLAAQFESFGCALIIIFTVPFGVAVAIFILKITGQTLNIYSQIGLVMLIGLMTKNAILLVEFMEQQRDEGSRVIEAMMIGSGVRLRPVLMTVLATVLGALPLIIAQGPGAEARSAIGWVIFGGLGLSTLITLYFTPLGYALIAPYVKPRADASKLLQQQVQATQ